MLTVMKTATLLLSCFFLVACFSLVDAQSDAKSAATIESGKFRFYETKQIRGEETYEITRSANGELVLTAKTDMPFAEQESKPQVNASLRMQSNLTPQSFEIKGPTLLEIQENTTISIDGKTATVQDRGSSSKSNLAQDVFTMSGYVPLSIEMMLIRYWLAHGRPQTISLLPAGEAFVEFRGKDTATISGKSIELNRFHLSGNNWRGGWGRQTIWLDADNRLVAAVNLGSDMETNLYAFRDGL